MVKRRTDRRRLVRKLKELRAEAWRRMHAPVGVLRPAEQLARLDTFYDEVCRIWYRVLNRRSQRPLLWPRFYALLDRFPLPRAHV